MDTDSLADAIAHARQSAATFNPGDVIDEKSGFTADNLLAVIAAPTPPAAEDEIVGKLGDLA